MMEGDGKTAIHMDGAVVVLLKNARASLMFTSPCDGVGNRDGLFVWDMDEERYFRIDPAYAAGTSCVRSWERRITRVKRNRKKRIFRFFFLRARLHTQIREYRLHTP